MNGLLRRTEKGKQRSSIIKLIVTTTGRFLESITKLNFIFLAQVILVSKSENLALHSICSLSMSTKGQ